MGGVGGEPDETVAAEPGELSKGRLAACEEEARSYSRVMTESNRSKVNSCSGILSKAVSTAGSAGSLTPVSSS